MSNIKMQAECKEVKEMENRAEFERFIDLFAELIAKYGADVLDEIGE